MAFTKNSNRIMAYADYDEIKPLEPKKITAPNTEIMWDKGASSGFSFRTNSDSKIFSVTVDGEYLGSNVESNMILHEGKVIIGRSEIVNLEAGSHDLLFTFDDGALPLTLTVTDENGITDTQTALADVNGDGRVSVLDVTCVQKYIAQFSSGTGRAGQKY